MDKIVAVTRYGEPIKVGRIYRFATVNSGTGYCDLKVTEIIDRDAVRVDDGFHGSRWACNCLIEVNK